MLKQDRKNFIPPRNNNDLTHTLEKLIAGKKVSVFIDAANLYHSASVAKLKIDFIQVIKWFKARCKLKNANFYTAYDIEDQKQMEFLQDLEFHGYSMIKKPLRVFENSKKGNMDIEIAVDCLTQQNLYDIIILISGDGDFSYLMQTLEKLGKDTVVIGVGGFTSFELHQEVNQYFFFNRIRSVWQKPRLESGEIQKKSIPNVLLPKTSIEKVLVKPKIKNKIVVQKEPIKFHNTKITEAPVKNKKSDTIRNGIQPQNRNDDNKKKPQKKYIKKTTGGPIQRPKTINSSSPTIYL